MNQNFTSSRRCFLASAALGAAVLTGTGARRAVAADKPKPNQRRTGLGFSLYGMKSLALVEGIRACSEIGYDCVELPVMADWPGDSSRFSAMARREFRAALDDSSVRLSAIMENLPLAVDDTKQRTQLDRVKAAAELSRELSPGLPAVIETILGGPVGKWDELKGSFVAVLRKWAAVLGDAKVVMAVKAHISNAMQRLEQVVWLLEQVDSPWIRAAYDYSHFQLQNISLDDSLKVLLPHSRFIHVKDSKTAGDKWQFALPGEGTINYGQLFQRVADSGYPGDIVVEVSGQVFSRPGYDPRAAARQSYEHLAPAFNQAGFPWREI